MRILTFSTLYPNAAAPAHGVFVENRLAALAKQSQVEIKVVAPVPWHPGPARWAGRYKPYVLAPRLETRRGIDVLHPRYFLPPRIGMTYAVSSLERCFLKTAAALVEAGWDFDLVDAHYLYPDGIAAVRAAKRLGKPVVLTARGSDVTLLPTFPRQREMILEATFGADAVISVAQALKDELVRIGAPVEKISVLRNGVDLDIFRPADRLEARSRLQLSGPVIASVGHLIERKGHHLVVEALNEIPEATLLIVGEGEERRRLKSLASRLGVLNRVRFLGAVAHERLCEVYSAADVLALASSREGWPNVLLEAMACGTPAAATPAHGSNEIITAPEAGVLAADRSAAAISKALLSVLRTPPDRAKTRIFAERHSWDDTAHAMFRIFSAVVHGRAKAAAVKTRRVGRTPKKPMLVVTVDTEESFNWNEFGQARSAVTDPSGIDRFQSLAAAFGIKPIYFLTSLVMEDAPSVAYFRELIADKSADLGLHLHPWETAPNGAYSGAYYSWQCNLPSELRLAKLQTLAARYRVAFGQDAIAHRAGRYGASIESCRELAAIGVALDFSPSPGFDFSKNGGPNFGQMSNAPFVVEMDGDSVGVLPVCGARSWKKSRLFLDQNQAAPGFPARQRPQSRLTSAMRLTCEAKSFIDLRALTQQLVARGTQVLTFSLHSTSMTPGANPYAASKIDVARMLEVCRAYFSWFREEFGGEFGTLDELADLYDLGRKEEFNLNRPLSAKA